MKPGDRVRVIESTWLFDGDAKGRTGAVDQMKLNSESMYEVAVILDGNTHESRFFTDELEVIS